MIKILELQEFETAVPAHADAGPGSAYSTLSLGAICLTSTFSISFCVP